MFREYFLYFDNLVSRDNFPYAIRFNKFNCINVTEFDYTMRIYFKIY